MALTNSQYETIMRSYAEQQRLNREELRKRRDYISEHLPAYEELEHAAAEKSVAFGIRLINGTETSVDALQEELQELTRQKAQLLAQAGLPEDYLEPPCKCRECHDTGFIDDRKCRCFKQQEIALLYSSSGLTSLEDHAGFAGIRTDLFTGEDQTRFLNALERSRQFVDRFSDERRNLLFYGTVGTGKSYLSSCIAKALLERGHSVMYFSVITLFEVLGDAAFHKEDSYDTDLINSCDLLIIDDLGCEITNRFIISQLFQCINERCLQGKSTIISTNLPLEELQERYTDRVFSRIIENYDVFRFTGPDIRIMTFGS